MISRIQKLAIAAAVAASVAGPAHAGSPDGKPVDQAPRNVVLVHGAFADGSGWRGVYDELTARGYRVSVVQNPPTSLADDVAATTRVLENQTAAPSWSATSGAAR